MDWESLNAPLELCYEHRSVVLIIDLVLVLVLVLATSELYHFPSALLVHYFTERISFLLRIFGLQPTPALHSKIIISDLI